MRPLLSSVIASLILLGQVGLPLHLHYCKGMLESVSVFVRSACDDHEEVVSVKACCKSSTPDNTCDKESDGCCDDETTIVTQEITSLPPKIFSDAVPALPADLPNWSGFKAASTTAFPLPARMCAIHGPPIYILHQALIFYA
jgi:hypothetical protein